MAAKKKAAKAGAVAAAPYVQRVVSDEELRENVRSAVESAREAFARLTGNKGPAKVVLDDKKFHRAVSSAAIAVKDASDALREAPKRSKPKKRGGIMGKLLLLLVGGGVAMAASEGLRNKVLDQLFGKEEEFDYSSTTTPASPPPAPAASGNGSESEATAATSS